MRLLHVTASYLPAVRYGGPIVSVHGLCRALAARGHDVHVFTTSVDGPDDSPVPHGTPVDVDGVTVWYFRSRWLRRLYRAPALRSALRQRVAGFDVVHTHAVFLWPMWQAARLAARAGVPYVVSPRGMLEQSLIERKSPVMKAGLIGFVEKRTLEHAAAVHVTSAHEARELDRFGFALPRVVQIPNGIDLDAFALARGAVSEAVVDAMARPFVLFLGRINWKKGLDRLMACWADVPETRLVVAGPDEEGYGTTLAELARRQGVTDRVMVIGPVDGADKAALLAGAALLVLPSYSENFGNVVLEAMAAGCPVVVTREVGLSPVVSESGAGVVVDGDAASLSGAIASLLQNPDQRRLMGARGREVAHARFSWPSVAAEMERVYQSLPTHRAAGGVVSLEEEEPGVVRA